MSVPASPPDRGGPPDPPCPWDHYTARSSRAQSCRGCAVPCACGC